MSDFVYDNLPLPGVKTNNGPRKVPANQVIDASEFNRTRDALTSLRSAITSSQGIVFQETSRDTSGAGLGAIRYHSGHLQTSENGGAWTDLGSGGGGGGDSFWASYDTATTKISGKVNAMVIGTDGNSRDNPSGGFIARNEGIADNPMFLFGNTYTAGIGLPAWGTWFRDDTTGAWLITSSGESSGTFATILQGSRHSAYESFIQNGDFKPWMRIEASAQAFTVGAGGRLVPAGNAVRSGGVVTVHAPDHRFGAGTELWKIGGVGDDGSFGPDSSGPSSFTVATWIDGDNFTYNDAGADATSTFDIYYSAETDVAYGRGSPGSAEIRLFNTTALRVGTDRLAYIIGGTDKLRVETDRLEFSDGVNLLSSGSSFNIGTTSGQPLTISSNSVHVQAGNILFNESLYQSDGWYNGGGQTQDIEVFVVGTGSGDATTTLPDINGRDWLLIYVKNEGQGSSNFLTVSPHSGQTVAGLASLSVPADAGFILRSVGTDWEPWYCPAYNHSSGTTGITAFAGGGQSSAVQLRAEINFVGTTATNGDSVKLPTGYLGKKVLVFNGGAHSLSVYPATGAQIDGAGANVAYSIPTGTARAFYGADGTFWRSSPLSDPDLSVYLTSSTAASTYLTISAAATTYPNVTIGTANGLSLSTQALSLALATTGSAGAMSGTDKTKLDGISVSGTNTGDITIGTFGTSPTANAASLSGQALTLQPADGSNPGAVSTATQTFAGAKTFSGGLLSASLGGTGTTTLTLTSPVADGSSAVGLTVNTSNALANGSAALMALQNNGVSKFIFYAAGGLSCSYGIINAGILYSTVADGGTAMQIGSSGAWTNTASKLLSVGTALGGTYSERSFFDLGGFFNGGVNALGGLTASAVLPPTVTLTATTGTLSAATYYYRVSAVTPQGETLASTELSKVVSASGGVIITWTVVKGATGYKVYGRTTGAEQLIQTVTSPSTLSYTDTGSATPSGALPSANTTGSIVLPAAASLYFGTTSPVSMTADSTTGILFGGTVKATGLLYTSSGVAMSNSSQMTLTSSVANGAGVSGFNFNTANVLSNATSRIMTFSCGATPFSGINFAGKYLYDTAAYTDATGTPGNATINKPSGKVAIALGASAVTVTNSQVLATSVVSCSINQASDDSTLTSIRWRVTVGSIIITGNAAATAAVAVTFEVRN